MNSPIAHDVGLLSNISKYELHTIPIALKDTFGKAWSYEAHYPQMLDKYITDIISERVQHFLELYSTDKGQFRDSRKELLTQPQRDIQEKYGDNDLFKVDTSTKKDQKGAGVHAMHQANNQHRQLYCCLYVVAVFQNSLTADLLRAENYTISLEAFKTLHQDTRFEVIREWQQAGSGGKKERVPASYCMADAFCEAEWEELFRFHNLFVLCFLVSPASKGQKNLFIHVASILALGKRAPQGGKPGKLIAAVGDVVFPYVTKLMCPEQTAAPKKSRPDARDICLQRAACVVPAFAPIAAVGALPPLSPVSGPALTSTGCPDEESDLPWPNLPLEALYDYDDFDLAYGSFADIPRDWSAPSLKRTNSAASVGDISCGPTVKRERGEPAAADSRSGKVTFTANLCADLEMSSEPSSAELQRALSFIRRQVEACEPQSVKYSLVATIY